jgi:hypothetical protein
MKQLTEQEAYNAEVVYLPVKRLSSIAGMDILAAAKNLSGAEPNGNAILWEMIFFLLFSVDLTAFVHHQPEDMRLKLRAHILRRACEDEEAYPGEQIDRLEQFCLVRMDSYGQAVRDADDLTTRDSYLLHTFSTYLSLGFASETMSPLKLRATGEASHPVILDPSGAVVIADPFMQVWVLSAFADSGLSGRFSSFGDAWGSLLTATTGNYLELSKTQLSAALESLGLKDWLP